MILTAHVKIELFKVNFLCYASERNLYIKGRTMVKQSLAFIRTIHEVPSNKPSNPNELLVRAGYIHVQGEQSISLLPLAKRVIQKIEKMIREEMNTLSANEVSLPILNFMEKPESNSFQNEQSDIEVFHLKNRNHKELYLASSQVDYITLLVKEEIQSYKQLPFILYQIRTKFRDEIHYNGMFRARESLMLDAFSFHHSSESLKAFYEKLDDVYSSVFRRLGLAYKKVAVDAGNDVGELSHEYFILSEKGDATIAYSNESDFAVNIELAQVPSPPLTEHCDMKELTKQNLHDTKQSLEELKNSLNSQAQQLIQSKAFVVHDELAVVLYRGDHRLNEVKLRNVLNVRKLTVADEEMIREIIGCSKEYIGPIKLPVNVKVYADYGIKSICNGTCFGNEDGSFYINVNPERDFAVNAYEDLRYIQEGDPSPDGIGTIEFLKGYDVAHTYMLGSAYAKKWDATFVDEFGDSNPVLMGAYGLGVSRIFGVASEFYQDEKGFAWPNALAPYDVHLITENVDNEDQWQISEQLYNILTTYQFDVLFDDRDTSIDSKFKDADLIGLSVQVIVGKKVNEGIVKVNYRRTGETFECAKEELIDRLNEYFRVY